MQFLCVCVNSTGSSIVTMCAWRVVLMKSIIAARDVDLPEPVEPVTSTSPELRLQSRSQTSMGMPNISKSGIWCGIARRTHATAPC